MKPDWKHTIVALSAAAGQLAEAAGSDPRVGLMLQALSRELRELATHSTESSPRTATRALLLAAERAAKVAEAAAGLHTTGDEPLLAAATSAIKLAHVLAADAQQRATPLLSQLADQELRDNFAHELAAHARQTEAIAAQLEPTA